MVAEEIIIKPIITEKSREAMVNEGKYTFEVNKKATKIDVKYAVEKLFDVKVVDVKTMNIKGKLRRRGVHVGRTSDWKKAIVTIATENCELTYTGKAGKEETVTTSHKTHRTYTDAHTRQGNQQFLYFSHNILLK